ncbi:MAG: hypothetical protein K2O67_04075 [Clostridia bacterium]|nr:hypothetical protein [Clostridia bacterium]
MKKLAKLCFLVPVPLIVGFILLMVGNHVGNPQLAQAGGMLMSYGTPAIMFILVVVGLVLMITGKLSDDTSKSSGTQSYDADGRSTGKPLSEIDMDGKAKVTAEEKEAEKIDDINSSYRYDSRNKLAEYQMDHVANAYASSNGREKVLGWLFFGFLMTDFAMILVFAFIGVYVGMFICFGIFGGTIIISLIVKIILEKTALSGRLRKNVEYVSREGIVKACFLSSMTSTGGSRRSSTVRVHSVTYRVIIIVDGREYSTYSRICYDVGQKLWVTVRKDGGRGIVIQNLPTGNEDNA